MAKSDNVKMPADGIAHYNDAPNPYREGSLRYGRLEKAKANSGRTVAEIRALQGMLPGTLGRYYRAGLVSINGVSLAR